MNARDLVLGRLRAALGEPVGPATVPRAYRRAGHLVPDLGLFADRLTAYRAHVHRCTDVAATIATVLPPGATVVVPPGLPAHWLPPSVTPLRDDDPPAGRLSADRLATVDAVVTAAAVAIAETGTVVLDGSADQGRRVISLLPDLHLCVVRADQVVAAVADALPRLRPDAPQTWISGPSATSDIELDRVEGVHGPRRLHVLLVP